MYMAKHAVCESSKLQGDCTIQEIEAQAMCRCRFR